MLHEAIYERQNRIPGITIPEVASVVGCGGTGFWTAVFLAMSGVKELILIDTDTLETSNLNRLPLTEATVGRTKTQAVKEFIENIRRPVRFEVHEQRIEKAKDCTLLRGTVFCCTDNLKSQQIICAYCRKNDIPYQRIGYDGTILNVSKAFPLSFEEVTDEGGYTVTPSWVIPAVLAAAAGVSSKLYKELCLMDDIGKMHIQGCSYVCPKILDDAKDEAREEGRDEIIDDGDYGSCCDCDRIDPDDSDYGYCGDCSRIDPDDEEYGYCPDCSRIDSDDLKEERAEAKDEGFDDGFEKAISDIKSNKVTNEELRKALNQWMQTNKEVEHDTEQAEQRQQPAGC